ncbi:MAG: ribosome recycling factor [Candidatus Magasanikbacteria bacterium]|nr:ribosome recycling factor [Candidatus Magasanikbacteria bacterium]
MSDYVSPHKVEFEKSIEFFRNDISNLRTGRVTPSLVEDVMVEAYGTKQALKSVASITVQDAKTIIVSPWDKSILQSIDLAIRNSSTGINPVNDGNVVRIILPDLSTERRQELIKVLHSKSENARITVRKIREDIRGIVDNAEKNKEISEDERYQNNEDLDIMVKHFNEKIKNISEKKEQDISAI